MIWKPISKGWATMTELETMFSHDDLIMANETIDALEKAEAKAKQAQ
jgi:hypothetical protein